MADVQQRIKDEQDEQEKRAWEASVRNAWHKSSH